MSQLLALIQLLGTDFTKVLPLITKIVAAAKAKDFTTLVAVVAELLALFVKTPKPTPGPVVFATPGGEEAAFVSEAQAAGCSQADIDALVAELK